MPKLEVYSLSFYSWVSRFSLRISQMEYLPGAYRLVENRSSPLVPGKLERNPALKTLLRKLRCPGNWSSLQGVLIFS